jgi:hypothetical protein
MEGTLTRSALLVVALTILGVAGWELYIRKVKGAEVAFDDGPPLWAHKRCMVYEPSDQATVFIGSSRIKYDLDIATWERITGDHAIQLATEGASPRPVLYDLAADENFRGKLIIDVTEVLFFGEGPLNALVDASINYYKDLTPAQRVSFVINKPLESTMAFLDKDNYSMNAMLDKLQIPSRAGVFMMPIFPMEFGRTSFERQAYMTSKFLVDTTLQNQVRAIWAFLQKSNQLPPVSGDTLRQVIASVKDATDKIKARGGQVLFVRTPSSGPFWAGEQMGFPREKYWNAVLETTGCKGIHFADYPATANFVCPEFSHLTPQDAVTYTEELIRILNEEMGWAFPKLPAKQIN